jgi:hypothetical protein
MFSCEQGNEMNDYAIENYNIATDARSRGPAKAPILYMENGDEIELPTHWAVCPVCDGNGKHVNPAIDAGGLSEEMMGDPDFIDGYMSGVYDQTCNRCEGKRVVPEVDWNAMTAEQHEMYEAQLEIEAGDEAERLAEIRAGC